MTIKSKTLRKVIIKFDSCFRKFYSKFFFYIVWAFYIRWNISEEDITKAKETWDDIYNSPTLSDYQTKLYQYEWKSDALKGLYDMTYDYVWLNFIPSVVEKFGRDCDDFAEMTYRWMNRVGYSEVVQVLYTPADLKHAHFVVMGKQNPNDNFIVKSNYSYARQTSFSNYKEAIEEYLSKTEECVNDIVWIVYRKETNQ